MLCVGRFGYNWSSPINLPHLRLQSILSGLGALVYYLQQYLGINRTVSGKKMTLLFFA